MIYVNDIFVLDLYIVSVVQMRLFLRESIPSQLGLSTLNTSDRKVTNIKKILCRFIFPNWFGSCLVEVLTLLIMTNEVRNPHVLKSSLFDVPTQLIKRENIHLWLVCINY